MLIINFCCVVCVYVLDINIVLVSVLVSYLCIGVGPL